MSNQNADEIIAEIKSLQDELEKLAVKRERIKFYRLSAEELAEELDAVTRQLETRKQWLGVNKT